MFEERAFAPVGAVRREGLRVKTMGSIMACLPVIWDMIYIKASIIRRT